MLTMLTVIDSSGTNVEFSGLLLWLSQQYSILLLYIYSENSNKSRPVKQTFWGVVARQIILNIFPDRSNCCSILIIANTFTYAQLHSLENDHHYLHPCPPFFDLNTRTLSFKARLVLNQV